MIKVGIISFAHMHAYDYANALKEMDDACLVSVFDSDSDRGKRAAKTFKADYYDDLQTFLSSDIEAVIVTSENSLHKHHVIACAEAGKDVLCEKPISTNVVDANLMIEACKVANVKLQVAYPVRFCSAIREGKQLVDSKSLGEILFIKTTNRGRNPGGWFIDTELSGGGAVLDHTVHMVDVVRWYTGLEIVKVNAQIDTMFSEEQIDDAGILDFEFENGLLMTHDCSWSKNQKYPTWGDVTIELIGSDGSLMIDAFKDHFTVYSDEGNSVTEYFSGNDMNLALIDDFIKCVKGDQPVSITGVDGLKSMAAALAAYESMQKNKAVLI